MADVRFRLSRHPMFVGSYRRVGIDIDRASGLTFEDLEFVVPDGPPAGLVSTSRDGEFTIRRPTILLLAGYEPGRYVIQALKRGSTTVVSEGTFIVNALWSDERVGPTRWFDGIGEGYTSSAAWGGGSDEPQNIAVTPAVGTRRVAILFVDTSSQRYTTNATEMQGHRDRWLDEIVNGINAGGVTRSARLFYREASYDNFDLSAQAFGPVQLPGTFDDYFNADGSPKGAYYQACFTAGDSIINYNNFDTLLCVSQSVTGPPAKSAWPYASIGNWGPYTTADGNLNRGVISMPNEWGTTDNREVYETFSHELGHNLGLGDQYTPSVPGRNPGSWEMMHDDDSFPHFSIAHRMMLGWVEADWLEPFNFQSMAAPVDETVTLSPVELGAPAAGYKIGAEIRLANGWNYYFEYRDDQTIQIGDRNLPTDAKILGTDVVSSPYEPPISRPAILLLNNDGDGDGAVLGNGQDYEEVDTTDPVYPTDFKIDVSGIDGTKADLRVRYGVNSRPDPSIRPWPAGPGRQWQSPDIEVRNARNQADPAWFNVPWVGNPNTVIASVKNNGGLDAPSVRVNFYVKNCNIGGAPETFLGTEVQNIPAGATVDFSTTWTPPSTGHYCVVVRIPLYQLPSDPAVVEMTELNNLAQSNYDRFISGTSSPGERIVSSVEVGNPYPIRTRIFVVGNQSNPLYRTYLGANWVTLDPGETYTIPVMYEFSLDPQELPDDPDLLEAFEIYYRQPNDVGFAAFIEDPRDNPRHAIQVLGGTQSQILTGRATEFSEFEVGEHFAQGLIVTRDDGSVVPHGTVILSLTVRGGRSPEIQNHTVEVHNGAFAIEFEERWQRAWATFIPAAGYADCESEILTP